MNPSNEHMFIFLFSYQILSLIISDIQSAIDELHKKTPFRTFYELFDEMESANLSNIKKKFRKMVSNKNIVLHNMEKYDKTKYQATDQELENLLTQGYNILTTQKAEYDRLLKNRFTLPFEPTSNLFFYFNLFIATIFMVFITDLLVSFLLYLKEKKRFGKMDKKQRKKEKTPTFPQFTLKKLFISRLFKTICWGCKE